MNHSCWRQWVGAIWAAVSLASPAALAFDYDGQDPVAPWRATAAQQIDQLRKSDINVLVELSDGSPVSGAQVQANMRRHAFRFGSAVDPRYFLESQPDYFNATYAEKVEQLFNTATLENHLKWRAWAGDFSSSFAPSVTQEGLDWLGARDIAVRGHNIMWPGSNHVPDAVDAILQLPSPTDADKQALYDATFAHINDIVPAVAGKLYVWDALNEPRGNQDIENMLVGFTPAGEATIADVADLRSRWYHAAQAADTNTAMFINEFGILPGDTDANAETRRTTFKDQIGDILAAGGVVDGIGFESHFADGLTNKQITGIPKLWAVLDDFQNQFSLPIEITEYDYSTTNLTLQAEYTRDFMTAVFAHPAVQSFVTWGFWEGKMANPDGAFFDTNWNLKPNGQEYLDLVFSDWWTTENGNTDGSGAYGVRGFKGDYQIVVDYQGQQFVFDEILSDGGLDLTVVIPGGGTTFLGGDILTAGDWDNGLPDGPLNHGWITTSGVASNQVSGYYVTQTAGKIDFSNSQAFRSSLEAGTEWHLQGGVITDSNSHFRVTDSLLVVEGGEVLLDVEKNINLAKGDSRIEITAGRIEARNIQFGTIGNTTPGSKVLEIGLGDGEVELLYANAPFVFGDDGDPENDYINFVSGTQGTITSGKLAAYFAQLWDDGNLRIDDLTSNALGLTFDQTLFSLLDNGDGTTTLFLRALAGDFNHDGVVSEQDLAVWKTAFGSGTGADADEDGDSDGVDFLTWQLNYIGTSSASTAVIAVPEPGTMTLAFLGVGLLYSKLLESSRFADFNRKRRRN